MAMVFRVIAGVVCCSLTLLVPLVAQAPLAVQAVPVTAFSVVSVHPSGPEIRSYYSPDKDGITERGNTLMWLIELAYGLLKPDFVIGAPAWASKEPFDLSAKVDENDLAAYAAMKPEARNALLRAVLKERFGMEAHEESRVFSQYGLRVAKGGIKAGLRVSGEAEPRSWKYPSRYHLEARHFDMAFLSYIALSTEAQLVVVDETGLKGNYDFELAWRRPPVGVAEETVSDDPVIFDAVKQQLGLEMVPERAPTRVLVIEKVERPTAN